jgi:hypothetical protein
MRSTCRFQGNGAAFTRLLRSGKLDFEKPASVWHLPVIQDQPPPPVQVPKVPVRELRVPEFQGQFLPRRWFRTPDRPMLPGPALDMQVVPVRAGKRVETPGPYDLVRADLGHRATRSIPEGMQEDVSQLMDDDLSHVLLRHLVHDRGQEE